MRVIDLLNKIAKGEESDLITEFVFDCRVWNFFKLNRSEFCLDGWLLNQDIKITKSLNDHIEIIEEEKEIEELNLMFPICNDIKNAELGGFASIYKSNLINIKYKIDEIIDELNKIKKEGK